MSDSPETKKADDAKPDELKEDDAVVTVHSIKVASGENIPYTVHCGRLPIKNDKGEIEALIFFQAYIRDMGNKPTSERPLMFSFNGGPGSSSVWLHLGALGPKRAALNPDGSLPPPPYSLKDNPLTWLAHSDLVFIDPVGTGYSKPKDEDTGKKFWSVEGDIKSLTEFIRLFLTRYERWNSPLYMVGESYGTTRGAGLAGALIEQGIALSGLLLISMVLNFQTLRFAPGNDLPYQLYLPSYAATAWYHKKLARRYQNKPIEKFLVEVEAFAAGAYQNALFQGDRLGARERKAVVTQLAAYTGLSENYIERTDLRIEHWKFCKELLRTEGVAVGRLDSRLARETRRGETEGPDFDASHADIMPPYTSLINDYLRRTLCVKFDERYKILDGLYAKWDWGKTDGYTDTSVPLRTALEKNPHLKVFVASGYFDLATPYWATEHTLAHLGVPKSARANVRTEYYTAGHMMYIEESNLKKLAADVASFLS